MGCVVSKDFKKPFAAFHGTSSWDRSIERSPMIQANRIVKMSANRGCLSTLFSSKHGLSRRHARVEHGQFGRHARVQDLNSKAFMQIISPKAPSAESYLTGGSCWPKDKRAADGRTSLASDMFDDISGALLMSMKSVPEFSESPKLLQRMAQNVETVSISELMRGLPEEEGSAASENCQQANHELSYLSVFLKKQEPPGSICTEPADEVYGTSPAAMLARRLGSNSWPSINYIGSHEDDITGFTGQFTRLPHLKSLRESLRWNKDPQTSSPVKNTAHNSSYLNHYDGGVDATIPSCSSVATLEDLSQVNCGTLQRALSMKYMLNDSNCEIPSLSTEAGRIDSLCFATPQFLLKHESTICSTAPKFSASASFKDWVNTLSAPASSSTCNKESSISDIHQNFRFPSEAPECCHAYDVADLKFLCKKSVENQWPCLRCQDEDDQESFGSPIFDPDMVDSFEMGIRHLSKDEWDAVKGMEDSPQNFLRLVRALKKSNSNCIRSQKKKAANLILCTINAEINAWKDVADQWEFPESTSSKYLLVQKKWVLKRHSSFDVENRFSQAKPKDDRVTSSVVFYSSTMPVTSNKAYEDCNQVRSILHSFVGISYDEKSVSELEENEEELRCVLGISFTIVPTIRVKGKYLVGIDSILHLYKRGLLGLMLQEAGGLPHKFEGSMQS